MSYSLSKRLLASENIVLRIMGAAIKRWWLWIVLLAALLPLILPSIFSGIPKLCPQWNMVFLLLIACASLAIVVSACNVLTDIYSLLRREKNVTICQIVILCALGAWIIVAIFILNIQREGTSFVVFGVVGSILTWIFQDKIKGAVAFIHFRTHGLLNIGDWIKVPKLDVDGEIKKVTLTTVTLYNWDTTTSTIPINSLQAEHFINLQNMSDGKTYGRRMLQRFTVDTGWIHSMDENELAELKSTDRDILKYLPQSELKAGVLNVHLYRIYLYHWLMQNPEVSQQPRLLVRWLEQKDSGMVLEVYAFLTGSELSGFEWQQSKIIEHVVESLGWFGLRLYQSPSAYDAGNANIYMSQTPATYKIESK